MRVSTGIIFVMWLAGSLASAQSASTLRPYLSRVERTADSSYLASLGLVGMMNRSIMPALANEAAKSDYGLDSAARLSGHLADAIKLHADDFDAVEPLPSVARIHAQMVAALRELHAGMDSLSTALGYRSIRERMEYDTRVLAGMTGVMGAQRHYEDSRRRLEAIAIQRKAKLRPLPTPVGAVK